MTYINNQSIAFMHKLITETSDIILNDTYYSLFLIKIKVEDYKIEFHNKKYELSISDKIRIISFIMHSEKKYYSNPFFRIDLENYILLFELYYDIGTFYLIGHMITNNYATKWDLINTRSKIDLDLIQQQVQICLHN